MAYDSRRGVHNGKEGVTVIADGCRRKQAVHCTGDAESELGVGGRL